MTAERQPRTAQAKEHIANVRAGSGVLALHRPSRERARVGAVAANETARLFEVESDKWQARANELLALLGGDVPENPLPGSIE